MSLLDLNLLPMTTTYGQRWTSEPIGSWEVNRTSEGIDVWTDPYNPLTSPQSRALSAALAEAGQPEEEDAA